jgi:hypothetical protein
LKTLASGPAIHNNEIEGGRDIITLRQETASNTTDGYFWLDIDGKIVSSSKFVNDDSLYEQFKDTNLEDQLYFTIPRTTEVTYYSSVSGSTEGAPMIDISVPIPSYKSFN